MTPDLGVEGRASLQAVYTWSKERGRFSARSQGLCFLLGSSGSPLRFQDRQEGAF